jgi:hypothetical protein
MNINDKAQNLPYPHRCQSHIRPIHCIKQDMQTIRFWLRHHQSCFPANQKARKLCYLGKYQLWGILSAGVSVVLIHSIFSLNRRISLEH